MGHLMIFAYDPTSEFHTDEKCHIVELCNAGADEGCSIARARVAPGVTTRLHALRGIVERYVILEGEGSVQIDGGAPEVVRTLDVAVIPAGASQRITNTGQSDLVFLCVCTPRFRADRYVALDP